MENLPNIFIPAKLESKNPFANNLTISVMFRNLPEKMTNLTRYVFLERWFVDSSKAGMTKRSDGFPVL